MPPPLQINPKVSWEEYERQVHDVLTSAGGRVNLQVTGKRTLKAGDGEDEYEVDASAELEMFGGALIKIIIECKCHTKPVNRDLVLTLHAKAQDLGAHKAMLFSTSGFQKGAVTYAKRYGISLVQLADGRVTYFTRSATAPERVPDFVPKLVCLMRYALGSWAVVGSSNPKEFREWVLAPNPVPSDEEPADDPTRDFTPGL
jgi:restriction system protein